MTLHEKILSIYPQLSGFDFAAGVITLQNDGDSDYILEWNHPELSCPTQNQLDEIGV